MPWWLSLSKLQLRRSKWRLPGFRLGAVRSNGGTGDQCTRRGAPSTMVECRSSKLTWMVRCIIPQWNIYFWPGFIRVIYFFNLMWKVIKSEKVNGTVAGNTRSQRWPTAGCPGLARWAVDFTKGHALPPRHTLGFALTQTKNDSAVVVRIHWVTSSHSN